MCDYEKNKDFIKERISSITFLVKQKEFNNTNFKLSSFFFFLENVKSVVQTN